MLKGMLSKTLHPGLLPWLTRLNHLIEEQRRKGIEATPAMVRDSLAGMTETLVTRIPDIAGVRDLVVDADGHAITVRAYDPAPGQRKPVCLFFHGGGHMAGSVQVYDPICRKLAEASGHLLLSVEYRLTPEHPYPAGLEDCLAVTRGLYPLLSREGYPVQRSLTLAGDSGGGALAATLSVLLQDDKEHRPQRQVLIYPSLDYTLDQPSLQENSHGYLLETPRIEWYVDHYFQHGEDRRAHSPLYMPMGTGMPETLMITAGLCPLRDEGLRYLDRLSEAGIPHQHVHFPDMIHAYLNLEDLVPEACAETYRCIGEFLGRARRLKNTPSSRA
ncbi:alpha/beta hydrolase domain-containing protein [Alcanivorax balearicus MACL04]|uniref:Alpha/beta hydrolase domain-containing protein n=1 Tax=Alloalcanivorax balearicus MACL04 TaxID=1177182 RepID=A0ABT2QYF8_9GAMM|nr:alpha/beta hydrolase [Alloalcanivorax balearicus]MCU5782559.1 alpha/beta hydrolase domain-containing protein [Alloalcanivorax balearicus MACL04]